MAFVCPVPATRKLVLVDHRFFCILSLITSPWQNGEPPHQEGCGQGRNKAARVEYKVRKLAGRPPIMQGPDVLFQNALLPKDNPPLVKLELVGHCCVVLKGLSG